MMLAQVVFPLSFPFCARCDNAMAEHKEGTRIHRSIDLQIVSLVTVAMMIIGNRFRSLHTRGTCDIGVKKVGHLSCGSTRNNAPPPASFLSTNS
jgi:hypothetical protein